MPLLFKWSAEWLVNWLNVVLTLYDIYSAEYVGSVLDNVDISLRLHLIVPLHVPNITNDRTGFHGWSHNCTWRQHRFHTQSKHLHRERYASHLVSLRNDLFVLEWLDSLAPMHTGLADHLHPIGIFVEDALLDCKQRLETGMKALHLFEHQLGYAWSRTLVGLHVKGIQHLYTKSRMSLHNGFSLTCIYVLLAQVLMMLLATVIMIVKKRYGNIEHCLLLAWVLMRRGHISTFVILVLDVAEMTHHP